MACGNVSTSRDISFIMLGNDEPKIWGKTAFCREVSKLANLDPNDTGRMTKKGIIVGNKGDSDKEIRSVSLMTHQDVKVEWKRFCSHVSYHFDDPRALTVQEITFLKQTKMRPRPEMTIDGKYINNSSPLMFSSTMVNPGHANYDLDKVLKEENKDLARKNLMLEKQAARNKLAHSGTSKERREKYLDCEVGGTKQKRKDDFRANAGGEPQKLYFPVGLRYGQCSFSVANWLLTNQMQPARLTYQVCLEHNPTIALDENKYPDYVPLGSSEACFSDSPDTLTDCDSSVIESVKLALTSKSSQVQKTSALGDLMRKMFRKDNKDNKSSKNNKSDKNQKGEKKDNEKIKGVNRGKHLSQVQDKKTTGFVTGGIRSDDSSDSD